jgi:hypothetical protein
MARLSATQLALLTSASPGSDGHLFPLPEGVPRAGSLRKSVEGLIKRALAAEVQVTNPGQAWRQEGDLRFGLVITEKGREAVNGNDAPPPALCSEVEQPAPTAAPSTKSALVLDLLKRGEGATLQELVEATGWLPHTTRAALTGVRKKGHVVGKGKRGEVTCYRIEEGC